MADPVWTLGSAVACVTEAPALHVWILRLPTASGPVLDACAMALGVPPPIAPNRAAGREPRVLWLAPGEWAVVSHNGADRVG
ncbi:MAG TPA: hypothetical protein VGN89_00850, partial [Phenylobacterium sp.]|nr:hypothetical protein [Phenylobacterium sp.]